jgi:hypothetical protein
MLKYHLSFFYSKLLSKNNFYEVTEIKLILINYFGGVRDNTNLTFFSGASKLFCISKNQI